MALPFVVFPSNIERSRDWRSVPGCTIAGHGALPLDGLGSWDALLAALPGPRPAFAVLDLSYPSLPPWTWDAPLPLVALAPDWALQRQLMLLALPRCVLAFSDTEGARTLREAGIGHVREARLFGLSAAFAAPYEEPSPERDIDVLFVGSLNPSVQGDRLPWLARLAKLSSRRRVRIATGVFGEEYRALLRRSRLAFNRSHHGEENQRLAEAASCGALPMLEAGNPEAEGVWLDGVHCARYGDDLEAVIGRWLSDEPARAEAAGRAATLAGERALTGELARIAAAVEAEWDAVQERHRSLPQLTRDELLLLRCWQALGAQHPCDPSLIGDLDAALDEPRGPAWAALGLAALVGRADPARAARRLRLGLARAPGSFLLGLGLCEALARLGEGRLAAEGAERLLAALLETGVPGEEALWPLPDPSFGPFRMGWQAADAKGRERVARWRLHSLLARETGDLLRYHEAALAWPEAPGTLAALGCALGRAGRPAEAARHLRAAVDADPFDLAASRALFQALSDAGATGAAARFARERRLLAQAAPGLVPDEGWLAPPMMPPAPAAPPPAPSVPTPAPLADVSWEGPLYAVSSLAHVNRRLALGLAARGLRVAARDVPSPGTPIPAGPERAALEALPQGSAAVTVRHAWPPDPAPPASGRWVLMQPWEYGSLPADWLPLLAQVDEAWVPTSFVARAFLDAGMPADRVRVVPLGADPELFRPGREPMALPTGKPVKLLFVGGTIHRKGFDVLLRAYGKAFTRDSRVCLVVKDTGVGTFYKGQGAGEAIRYFKAVPANPEVLHMEEDLDEEALASLVAACDALVLPYRGEGFGLPLAEAMAAGLPVVCTGMGAALDFVDEEVGWLVPAKRIDFPENRIGDLRTVGTPWLAEPDEDALAAILAEVVASPEERRKRGAAGRERVEERLSWSHCLDAVQAALAEVAARPVRRPDASAPTAAVDGMVLELHPPERDLWVSRPLLAGQPYEPLAAQAMRTLARPGDTVLDVGANIGVHAVRLSRLVGPSGKVFAVEPEPGNLALLRRNLERNGCTNVTVLAVAASDRDGTVRLALSPDNQGDHRTVAGGEGRAGVEVPCARLDGLLEDAGPFSFVKLDVQGAEGLALAGLERTLARSPNAAVLLELWSWALERAGTPAASVLSLLRARGCAFEVLDERHGQAVPVEADALLRGLPVREDAFVNVLARPARVPAVARAMPDALPGASLCVIARNEEANIGDCLRSCEGLFGEMVVVDTGSTDRTKEIALSLGAKVLDFPWIDDFAAARNETLKHATRRWVFWMDADDRLDAANREKLRALLASLPEDLGTAYSMKCRCLPDPETGSATMVDHMRLFPRLPGVTWRYRVHEQILPSLRACGVAVAFADVRIDHTGYVDPALRGRKLARDLRLLLLQRQDMGDEPFTLFNLGATYLEMGKHEEALPLLEGSLARSHRSDSIVRKLHSLAAHCHIRAGRRPEALKAVLRGLRDCPGDAELLLMEGALRLEDRDFHGARNALVGLVAGEAEGGHFASVTDGLRTFRARHHLAEACMGLGEEADAELLWRRACVEAPSWRPPRSALASLVLRQRRWDELEAQARELEGIAGAAGEAAWLRGKALLDRGDAPGAAALLGEAAARLPGDGAVAMLLASALEAAGRSDEAEKRLEEALAASPGHAMLARERDRLRGLREARDRAFLPGGMG